MTLSQKQRAFTRCVGKLITKAYAMGYEVTLGDAYRDARTYGDYGTRKGYGSSRSNHKLRLAIDLNLFKDGRYLRSTVAHEPLGKWWEALGRSEDLDLVWGGSDGNADGNHYSCRHWGRW